VRRHPDIPWLRRVTDLPSLVQTQRRLLDALWPTLAPGGRLLYCTCSVFHAEGQAQIQAFLANNTDAGLRPSPGSLLPGIPFQGAGVSDNLTAEHDGFFYALLEKQ
jgi:16S rRNA (cytosine967-C5)-methyltransferase